MPPDSNKNTLNSLPFIFLAILFSYQPLFSQDSIKKDTTLFKVSRGSFFKIKETTRFIPKDTLIKLSGAFVTADSARNRKTILFYDSLKIKASRSMLTKALYDLVIVSPDTINKKKITGNSQEIFREYSGKRIRKIEVRRLNVFGADVNNPGLYNPRGLEKLLNSTHINTNENVLRKYLLFAEGDTLSPLTLSDNERIIRELPFINDARIIVVPVSGEEADIIVLTRDTYSLGFDLNIRSPRSGTIKMFDANFLGVGHEFELDIPYSTGSPNSPGIAMKYKISNLFKSFIDLNLNYYNAFGKRSYGINATKNLISSTTKYAGGVSLLDTLTTINLDSLTKPLKKTYQDYWLLRSFLINKESVTRIIAGIRYTNNNPYERPEIDPQTNYRLQKYRLFLGSAALSFQKFYKTNLIYNYGRTEDIPYGALMRLTAGLEVNEFKRRIYSGLDVSFGQSIQSLGYFYSSAGFGTFIRNDSTEQGVFSARVKYISNLINLGQYRIRNFINVDYTRGFDRYNDEFLFIPRGDGFTGFKNDSLRGTQRIYLNLETVVFSPTIIYGFRFAFFGFADMAFLAANREVVNNGRFLSDIGLGVRIRNDNLIFNTFQIKLGYFPNFPVYSKINNVNISGEELLRPNNFTPGPPSVVPFR
jgi:hypothetical protein